jgi:osmotically inducible protein OsmC
MARPKERYTPMPLAERTATTTWTGDLASGSGELSFATGAVSGLPVSWAARAETPGGKTSPEELLAAAQSSCFAMALSGGLARAGHPAERLDVSATCTLDRIDGKPTVTNMHISVRGVVPGIEESAFQELTADAAKGCPVARAIQGNVAQQLTASLISE